MRTRWTKKCVLDNSQRFLNSSQIVSSQGKIKIKGISSFCYCSILRVWCISSDVSSCCLRKCLFAFVYAFSCLCTAVPRVPAQVAIQDDIGEIMLLFPIVLFLHWMATRMSALEITPHAFPRPLSHCSHSHSSRCVSVSHSSSQSNFCDISPLWNPNDLYKKQLRKEKPVGIVHEPNANAVDDGLNIKTDDPVPVCF